MFSTRNGFLLGLLYLSITSILSFQNNDLVKREHASAMASRKVWLDTWLNALLGFNSTVSPTAIATSTSSPMPKLDKNQQSFSPSPSPSSSPSPDPNQQGTPVPTSHPERLLQTTPTPTPTPSPMDSVTPSPTPQPISLVTPKPSPQPIQKVTPMPTSQPITPLTPSPTSKPTRMPTNRKTQNPTSVPTYSLTKNATISPSRPLTDKPSKAPSKSPTRVLQKGQIRNVTMIFDDCPILDTKSCQTWENVTQDFITNIMKKTIASIYDINVTIHFRNQSASIVAWESALLQHKNRALLASQQSPLSIRFDADISFRSPINNHNVQDYFRSTLDSEGERASYIVQLQDSDDPIFNGINSVTVEMSGVDILTMDRSKPINKNATNLPIAIITLAIVGVSVFVLSGLAFVYFRRRKVAKDDLSTTKKHTADETDEICFDIENKSTAISSIGDGMEWSVVSFGKTTQNRSDTVKNQAQAETASVSIAGIEAENEMSFEDFTLSSYFPSELSQEPSNKLYEPYEDTSIALEKMYETDVASWDCGTFDDEITSLGTRIEVNVPPGRLGACIDSSSGIPTVESINPSSVLASKVCVGDILLFVDGISTYGLSAVEVLHLVGSRANEPTRTLTFARNQRILKETVEP